MLRNMLEKLHVWKQKVDEVARNAYRKPLDVNSCRVLSGNEREFNIIAGMYHVKTQSDPGRGVKHSKTHY